MNLWKSKGLICLLILTGVLLLSCSGPAPGKDLDGAALLKESIETMAQLNSYGVNASVETYGEDSDRRLALLQATITYHRSPFAYSNLQELSAVSEDATQPDTQFTFYLFAKENNVYLFNSLTGLWNRDDSEAVNQNVASLANIFGSFDSEEFQDVKITKEQDDKATLEGKTSGSAFLYNLMQSFDSGLTGTFTAVINTQTKHMESFTYICPTDTGREEIDLMIKDFNQAAEVVIPSSALEAE